ncbi:MAG TPA: ATP-binding protein [Planctomycetota bacterium]|jgi:PAS domain S-box-containing protein|nr:ATP-binding protein [Planctomycetota bacterium]
MPISPALATPDFQALFESAPGLYLVLGPDLRIVAVSDAYLRATMTERAQIVGRGLFEVFPDNPADPIATGVDNLRASLQRVLDGKVADAMAVQKYDIQRPAAEGGGFEERYWSPMNSPVLDAGGALVYIIHRVEDVTEFVRLKELGLEQDKRTEELRRRTDNMALEVLQRAQQIQGMNRQLLEANAELARKDEERARLSEQLRELERTRAESALRQSEEKFRQLADNIPEVFWMTTCDMSEVVYVSPAYKDIWGRSVESLYAHPQEWMDAVLPEDRAMVTESFAKLARGESQVGAEYRIRRPDGSIRWLSDRGFPVRDANGKPYRSAGIAQDITERKRLEENLRRSQKMEAVGQLAGGIAHDFNNILGCIIGYTELVELDVGANESALAHLDEVLKASQRAKELILQILTFSRHQEQGRKAMHLQSVVVEALKLLRASLPSTVDIRADIAADAPSVLANDTQLQQVLMNLATNAAHAMDGRGELKVRLTTLDVDAEYARTQVDLRAGRHVVLSVSDTGCGMDRETQQHIFEPFFTTKGPGEGTGLGLAMVHGIVKSHEGAISVYSEPGQGTTFQIYFPAVASEKRGDERLDDALPRGNGERILLVDDEPALAAVGRLMLERAGYVVFAHTRSVDALEAFRARPDEFDLVVTDLTMPELNGVDLAREILQVRASTPIILATGFGGAMTQAKVQALGIRELLFKPATARSLTESIQRVLSGSRVA